MVDELGRPIPTLVADIAVALTLSGTVGDAAAVAAAELDDDDFLKLLLLCESHRLLGSLADAVETGRLPVTASQRSLLEEKLLVWLSHSIEVERLLLRVGECCARAGIPMRVLKGVALAHLVYPDPAQRVFADLDLLVPGDRFEEVAALARDELGGIQSVAELRPGFDREFGKDATVKVGRVELDLHRTFVTGPFGLTIPLGDLFADGTPLMVGGQTFAALDPAPMLLHACYNAALGDLPVRLCALRDLLLLCATPGADLDRVVELARSWGGIAVVRRAAQLAVAELSLPASHPLAALTAVPVPRRERWALRSYLSPARSYSRPLASLLVIPGVRARVRYLRALVRPSGEYLASRGWTNASHRRRAVARARGVSRD
jgi:hypothetical protein